MEPEEIRKKVLDISQSQQIEKELDKVTPWQEIQTDSESEPDFSECMQEFFRSCAEPTFRMITADWLKQHGALLFALEFKKLDLTQTRQEVQKAGVCPPKKRKKD